MALLTGTPLGGWLVGPLKGRLVPADWWALESWLVRPLEGWLVALMTGGFLKGWQASLLEGRLVALLTGRLLKGSLWALWKAGCVSMSLEDKQVGFILIGGPRKTG